jgi:hypothetical protein
MVEVPGVALMVDAAMTFRAMVDLTTVSKPPHADAILPVIGIMPAPITIITSKTQMCSARHVNVLANLQPRVICWLRLCFLRNI